MDIPGFCERAIEAVQHKQGDKSPETVAEVLEIDHVTRKMAQSDHYGVVCISSNLQQIHTFIQGTPLNGSLCPASAL